MCNTVYLDEPSFKKFKGFQENMFHPSLMTMDLYRKIIDECSQYDTFFSIKLNYRGESALHPNLCDMIKYAKEKNVFDIMMNTNGNYDTRLNRSMVEAGLTWISFSLDAITPQTYHKVRVGGDFYVAYSNAIDMCRYADILNVQVSFIKHKQNQEEAEDFVKFWKSTAAHKIVVSDFYNPGELIKNENAFTIKDYNPIDSFCCPQLWQRIVIFNDGRIFPCCHSFAAPEDMYLGNLADTTVKQAWDSDKLRNIRELHAAGNYKNVATCSKCAYPKKPIDRSEQ